MADTGTLYFYHSCYDREDDTLERVEQIVIETALACKLPVKYVGHAVAVAVGRLTAACGAKYHCDCCNYGECVSHVPPRQHA